MVTIENIEAWIEENGDTAGFFSTEALVNHFVDESKAELIEKACEWLESNLCCYDEKYRGIDSGNSLIEDFKQAMMEE